MNLKKGISDACRKIAGSDFLLMINGNRELIFEDCRRILEYSRERIVLEGNLRVEIIGENLKLMHLGNRNLSASGDLSEIKILARARK